MPGRNARSRRTDARKLTLSAFCLSLVNCCFDSQPTRMYQCFFASTTCQPVAIRQRQPERHPRNVLRPPRRSFISNALLVLARHKSLAVIFDPSISYRAAVRRRFAPSLRNPVNNRPPSFAACKNSSPCGKIYTLRISRFFRYVSQRQLYVLEFSGSYEIQSVSGRKVASPFSDRKVSEYPPARENRSSHNDKPHKEAWK
jgi:hypothetical protein